MTWADHHGAKADGARHDVVGVSFASAGAMARGLAATVPRLKVIMDIKEDEVLKISTSVFVANFPDSFGAKDLWNTCKQYGQVVDAYIPYERSKAGKRFGFVRFIKVLDVDRLVDNLCTVWVGRHKLQANILSFQREPLKRHSSLHNIDGVKRGNSEDTYNSNGVKGAANSYVHVVKGSQNSKIDSDSSPVMVLDDSCLNEKDYSLCLMGKVKDFATLANLKVVVANERFDNIKFKYMGGAKEVPGWILDFVEDNDEEEDSKVGSYEEVPNGEDVKNVENLEGEEDSVGQGNVQAEDPFNIYELLNHKRQVVDKNSNSKESLKYPPGYTPTGSHFKKSEVPKSGGSILHLIDDLVKVGETMGYDMKGCMKNMEEIIELQGANDCIDEFFVVEYPRPRPKGRKRLGQGDLHYFVMVRGDWMPNGKKPLIISVYAPQGLSEKKMLWDYVSLVMSKWQGEVVIMGDFNEVRNKSKKFGTLFNRHSTNVFNRFISNARLEEVPLEGCSFTWCHRFATKMTKLYRFLISDSFLCSCPNISSITLDRNLSDHRPILMREVYYDYGPVPFRLFHYWFEVDGFDNFIEDSWKDAPIIESNALVRMMKKLMYLKEKISTWNKLNKEKSHKSKRSLLAELADCDAIIDKDEGENNVVNRRTEVVKLLQEVEKKNSLEAGQKVKIKWAIEGDENSKYYHGVINKKRNQLSIHGILVEGTWIDYPSLVKISKEEIKKAVWDCRIDKSPGPDGFTFGFYRRYWKLIENDVVDAVTCFFHQGSFPKGGNSCFIILIHKTPNANMVKDYRPISLIESMYKFISKILANRLVVVLGGLVNKIQSAFVADKQILDGLFILNELVQWCKKKKKQSLVFKVDFEKACLRSSRGSVIVNGSPTKEFQFYKGLKQGDPLSPFLFILDIESLHMSFQRVVDVGLFKGIELAPSLNRSHMFYADDAIFMGQWSESNIDTIVKVLDCFNRASGLRINMTKSKLLGIFVEDDKSWNETIERMACRLSKWKLKTLSIGGRLTLLKSVLGSMPIYHMSLFKVPKKVIHRMKSMRSHFFNGAELSSKKSAWVKWKYALAFKDKCGLGVSSLFALNRALMLKWKVKSCYPSLWLDIIHEVEMFKKMIDDFMLSEVSSKTRWIKAVPIKVNVHAWKDKLDGLPTRLNISRR
nr:RNA-directed DNA polymerase, eukaryota, reverse transcriptase zinc-binding domain protein [Tanacetum cinerariifolium]